MQAEQAEVQIRLTVDVTYSLNGETTATMAALLSRLCDQAIGDGMLTGGTSATVESHEVTTTLMPALAVGTRDGSARRTCECHHCSGCEGADFSRLWLEAKP
jgi:hypothetical protein